MGQYTKEEIHPYGTCSATWKAEVDTSCDFKSTQDFKVTLDNTVGLSQVQIRHKFYLPLIAKINFANCKLL